MTYLENYMGEHIDEAEDDVVKTKCPAERELVCANRPNDQICFECWNSEIPDIKEGIKYGVENRDPELVKALEEKTNKLKGQMESDFLIKNFVIPEDDNPKGHIKDSGTRREFETGAVRDIQEGKGRCDLMPLDVCSHVIQDNIIMYINIFQKDGYINDLITALWNFSNHWSTDDKDCQTTKRCTMLLEASKHFEDGAKKYGENNWQKGIPTHCYIDSAVRHYLKYLRGDKDEPHDRAFVWNILCCIWTCIHKPELNDYAKKEEHKQPDAPYDFDAVM